MVVRHRRALAVLVALPLLGCTPTLDWREVRPDGAGGLLALFPCKPVSHARMIAIEGQQTRLTLHACSAGDATWAVAVADVQEPARVGPALTALQRAAQANVAATTAVPVAGSVPGATPSPAAGRFAATGRFPDGREAHMQSALFARGTVVIQATALGVRLRADALETFFGSLRLVP